MDAFPPNVYSTHIPLLGVAQELAARLAYFLGLRFSLPSVCRELIIRDVVLGHVGDTSWKVHAVLYNLLLLVANPGLAPLTNFVTWDKFTYLLGAFVYLSIKWSLWHLIHKLYRGPRWNKVDKVPNTVGTIVFITVVLFYSHQKSSGRCGVGYVQV